MRHIWLLLRGLGVVMLAVIGCKTQPDLRPPETPQILATPGPNDKRYQEPFSYPPDVLANDEFKKSMAQQGFTQARATGRPQGMSLGSMGGGGTP